MKHGLIVQNVLFFYLFLAEKLEEAAKTFRHLGETIIDTLKEKDIIVIVEEKEIFTKTGATLK